MVSATPLILQQNPSSRSETGFPSGTGFKDRPDTTFGTVNADVLEHFVPGFRRTDFVEVIKSNAWPQ
jgi:hypothetical protein